jgi:hypothetical protein
MKLYVAEVMADCSVRVHEAEAKETEKGYSLSGRDRAFGYFKLIRKIDALGFRMATTRQEALRLLSEEMHKQLLRLKNQEGTIKLTLDAIVALENE